MKIKRASIVLAAAFIAFGVLWADILTKFSGVYTELELTLPSFTRFVLVPEPLGWFGIGIILAGFVLWKDFWSRFRVPNSFFVIVIAVEVLTLATAIFLPLMEIGPGLGK